MKIYPRHKVFVNDFQRIVMIGIGLEQHQSPSCSFCFLFLNNVGEKDRGRSTFMLVIKFLFLILKGF